MQQKFNCKEPDCNAKVVFEYEPVIGVLMKFNIEETEVEEEVYLTCENSHTHKYKVKYKPSK